MPQDSASRYRGTYGSSAASTGPNTMNNFQYTQLGTTTGTAVGSVVPGLGNIAGAAIGAGIGFTADLFTGKKRKKEADIALMDSISQDAYNQNVTNIQNPYTMDGGYQQAMSFSKGGTVRRFYKDGGPVGHVIPAERAGQAVVDAAKAGIDLQKPASRTGNQEGIIPGAGHPKADDKLMTPGGQPIRVSSGEVYVDDDTMRRMAEAVGIGIGSYAKLMYPDTKHGDGFADGGEVDPPPNGIPPNWAPSNPYGTGQYASATYMDLVGQQLLSPERSFANFKEKREPVPSRMTVRGMESSPLNPQLKGTGSSAPKASSPVSVGRSDGTEGMNKTNNIAFGTNLALGTASLIHNALQKGPSIPKPPTYTPEKLDLKTGALSAELDRRRVSGVASAGYSTANKQGLARDLGLRSIDLAQRSQDAMAVENVANQERSGNTQIENQARLYNNQSLQRWMERDQEAQMNFRREKGDRMSMSLAGISDATSAWASGKQQIGAMGQMNDFNDRYLRYLSGNAETAEWDGSTIHFGDGTSTKRVQRGIKLYDPQDYRYISNRFIR